MKILAVDDTPDNLVLLTHLLEEDHEILTARNGAECLSLARNNHPDIILLDIMMPGMDGYEVLRRLQEDETTRGIIVICLTAKYKDDDRVVRGLDMGAFDYLVKPIDNDVLLARIRGAARILKAEKALRKAHDELERRVDERTAELAASLSEKEVLLREVHHRVKNNMQVIASLLRTLARKTKDKKIIEAFDKCRDRIRVMSMIHEALHQSPDLSKVDFDRYLKKLIGNLCQAHDATDGRIGWTVDAGNLSLGIDQAVPFGLLVNELVSNAFKHAFPGNRRGEIRVSMTAGVGNEISLEISDDGIGLPEDLDIRNTDTLGFELAVGLAEQQLHGSIAVDGTAGTRFLIRFAPDDTGERI